jgi:hypothetical protein
VRRRDFGLLVASRAVSTFGTGFGPVALAFGLLAIPGGGSGTLSLVLSCHALPQVLFVLPAGALADRLPRIALLATAETSAAVAWAVLGVMLLVGDAPTVALAGCAALAGLASAAVGPALTGLVPDVVPADGLRAANSSLKAVTHAARLAGLSTAGPVVALIGPGWTVLVDAGSYLLAAAVLSILRPTRCVPPTTPSGMLGDLREGLREFTGRQWLWVLVAAYSFVYATVGAVAGVLGPLSAHAYLGGAPAWSLVLAAQSGGTLAGALVARWIEPPRPALVVALLISIPGLPMVLLALAAPLALVALGAAGAGIAAGLVSVLTATVIQHQVPAAALSRVTAYEWLGSLALAPLGLALAGPAAQTFGTRPTLAGCAVVVSAASVAAMSAPQVRALRGSTAGPDKVSSTCRAALAEPETSG